MAFLFTLHTAECRDQKALLDDYGCIKLLLSTWSKVENFHFCGIV